MWFSTHFTAQKYTSDLSKLWQVTKHFHSSPTEKKFFLIAMAKTKKTTQYKKAADVDSFKCVVYDTTASRSQWWYEKLNEWWVYVEHCAMHNCTNGTTHVSMYRFWLLVDVHHHDNRTMKICLFSKMLSILSELKLGLQAYFCHYVLSIDYRQ